MSARWMSAPRHESLAERTLLSLTDPFFFDRCFFFYPSPSPLLVCKTVRSPWWGRWSVNVHARVLFLCSNSVLAGGWSQWPIVPCVLGSIAMTNADVHRRGRDRPYRSRHHGGAPGCPCDRNYPEKDTLRLTLYSSLPPPLHPRGCSRRPMLPAKTICLPTSIPAHSPRLTALFPAQLTLTHPASSPLHRSHPPRPGTRSGCDPAPPASSPASSYHGTQGHTPAS